VLWVTVPEMPDYLGFQLSDSWMQSLDQANYVTSRNQSQMNFDADGSSYLVVAREDPGVRNWIDTTGLETAQMTFRFWYREEPSPKQYPKIRAEKVLFAELSGVIETDPVQEFGPAARRLEIAARQKHMRLRFRQH
jgi:hypothetical protein